MRSTRSIEILCLALATLVLVWSGALMARLWPVLGLLGLFVAAIVVFRTRGFLPGRSRTKLIIESWSMVIFITGVLWFSGKSASPLLNLYLLPIILSAFTLGRLITRNRPERSELAGRSIAFAPTSSWDVWVQ